MSDNERMDKVEHTTAAYAVDHTGWLLALQAIVAASVVRQASASPDPARFLQEHEKFAREVVASTRFADTISGVSADQFLDRSNEKLATFFKGIQISR